MRWRSGGLDSDDEDGGSIGVGDLESGIRSKRSRRPVDDSSSFFSRIFPAWRVSLRDFVQYRRRFWVLSIAIVFVIIVSFGTSYFVFHSLKISLIRTSHSYCYEWREDSSNPFHPKCVGMCGNQTLCVQQVYNSVRRPIPKNAISLATVGTIDRIGPFLSTIENWKGPKVLVLYCGTGAIPELSDCSQTIYELRKIGLRRFTNTQIVLFSPPHWSQENDYNTFRSIRDGESFSRIPINTLRNVAMDLVRSEFVFMIDIDLIPSVNAYDSMQSLLKQMVGLGGRSAFVVLPFKTLQCASLIAETGFEFVIPQTFDSLISEWIHGRVLPWRCRQYPLDYHYMSEARNQETNSVDRGHFLDPTCVDPYLDVNSRKRSFCPIQGVSNFTEWSRSAAPGLYRIHPVRWSARKDCGKFSYEPWVVVRKSSALPRYNEMYTGRFRNKVEWVYKLVQQHFAFYGVRGPFLVHSPHSSFNVLEDDDDTFHHHYRMENLFREQLCRDDESNISDLVSFYDDQVRQPI